MPGSKPNPPKASPSGTPPDDDQTLVQKSVVEDDFAFAEGGDTGFNYDAFEESLADVDQEITDDPDTDPGSDAPQVHQRFTLDTQRFPKDDATADTRELGDFTVVTIRGRLNESFEGQELGSRLRGRVVFDLTEVDRVTSFGVRSWLQMLDAARLKEAVFVRASPAIVNQVTMMRNFCGVAQIHSIVAPYACEACGAEFGVPYEAVADRGAMRARNPLKVACPQCSAAAVMDEDPWVFFALDEVLLDEVPADLERVIDNIGDVPRHAPIEKAIVGDSTRVRFNGMVSGDTRFQRAFTGLEGNVTVDLRTATEVDNEGVAGLVDQLGRLPAEVRLLVVEGAPASMVRALLSTPIDRVFVGSAVVTVRSLARPLEREVVVDLKRDRAQITSGSFIPDVPWRSDPLEVDDLEVLQASVARLLPPDRGATPPPVPRGTLPPAPAAPAPPPSGNTNAAMVAAIAGGGVAVLLLVGAIGAGVFFSAEQNAAGPPAPVPVADVAPGQWSSGGVLPPDWSEVGLATNGDQMLVVGHGEGASAQDAAVAARREALDRLLVHVSSTLRAPFEDEALPADGAEREAALALFEVATSGLGLSRSQEALRTEGDTTEMVVQYAVQSDALSSFVDRYSRVSEFRGITLGHSAPWAPAGVRLVKRESFIRNVLPGDQLVSVGGTQVDSLDGFEAASSKAFGALAPGAALNVVFDRAGKRVETNVFKANRSSNPEPQTAPSQTPRPTLFKKD